MYFKMVWFVSTVNIKHCITLSSLRIDADENELFACHKVEKYPQLILYPGER